MNLKRKIGAALTAVCILGGASAFAAAPAVQPGAVTAAGNPAVSEVSSQQQLASQEIMGLLWMRTSAEYRALCYQGYNIALAEVDKALADSSRTGKPLAIVLDCDETVLDNTPAMAAEAAKGNGLYTSRWWRDTVRRGESLAMPGAAEFLQEVDRRGVAIFYVSNRYGAYNYDATEKNLKELHFPQADPEHILLMADSPNKQIRYDRIARDYDVVIYMGDNAEDLPIGINGKSMEERAGIMDENQKYFGTRYILFPNPAYGSWVRALADGYMNMTPEERDTVNRMLLERK